MILEFPQLTDNRPSEVEVLIILLQSERFMLKCYPVNKDTRYFTMFCDGCATIFATK